MADRLQLTLFLALVQRHPSKLPAQSRGQEHCNVYVECNPADTGHCEAGGRRRLWGTIRAASAATWQPRRQHLAAHGLCLWAATICGAASTHVSMPASTPRTPGLTGDASPRTPSGRAHSGVPTSVSGAASMRFDARFPCQRGPLSILGTALSTALGSAFHISDEGRSKLRVSAPSGS
jgi:hypothetical protein